jgi:hypothetical protein
MQTAIERGWADREVEVPREQLVKALKANRTKHIAEYNAAMAGYKEQAMASLIKLKASILAQVERNFGVIAKRIEELDPEEPLGDHVSLVSSTSFSLRMPQSHEKDYDVAIGMAEWEVNPTIKLPQSLFQCFVMDDWDWKNAFATLNKGYTSGHSR